MKVLGVENLLAQPIYDTVQLAAVAGQTVSFFLVPLNGALTAAIAKTYAHTNMVQSGRLEIGKSLTVTHVSFAIKGTVAAGTAVTLADFRAIYQASHLNFMIGGTTFLRLPLNLMPPANSESQYFSNIAAAATEFQNNHGMGSIHNRLPIQPIVLEEMETIQVDLFVGYTVVAVTDISLFLWGKMTRPVR